MSRKDQFINERNWQTQQLCILIAMLNQIGDVTIERPQKMKTKSLVFFKVTLIQIGNKTFDIKRLTTTRIEQLSERDKQYKLSEITMKRRRDVYKIMEHIHVLMDIVIQETRFKIFTTNDKHNSLEDKRVLKTIEMDDIIISQSIQHSNFRFKF